MSRLLLGSLSVLALSAGAQAADLYRNSERVSFKDPVVYAPGWTGFYGGVNGGYAWGNDSHVTAGVDTALIQVPVPLTAAIDPPFQPSGAFGGGQIGYNWQGVYHPNLVVGVEADIQGADISGDEAQTAATNGGSSIVRAESRLDWFGSVRGRIGYDAGSMLVYATGGFAFGGVKDKLAVTASFGGASDTASIHEDRTATGYTVGGGVEHTLSRAWSLKAEYQYIDLGSDTLSATKTLTVPGVAVVTATGKGEYDHSYNTVRVGLNYHIQSGYDPIK
jgi:outer membrane immunogenic protein